MLTDEAPELSFPIDRLTVEAWPDPVIDQLGHDPRSAYVERFWLGVLGPSRIAIEPVALKEDNATTPKSPPMAR